MSDEIDADALDDTEETSEEPTTTDEPAAPSGPWADALAERFDDPQQRAAVDEFLRDTVQPHVTRLEQDTAENRNASRLWEDFRTQPVETYAAVTEELFGDELGQKIVGILNDDDPSDAALDDLEDLADEQGQAQELPPEVQELIEEKRARERKELYEARVEEAIEQADVEVNRDLLHPFVVAADGDIEAAVAGYEQWAQQASETFGGETAEDEGDTPPPTIDSSSRSPSTPPVQKEYESLDEAIDDFIAEQQDAPTTV